VDDIFCEVVGVSDLPATCSYPVSPGFWQDFSTELNVFLRRTAVLQTRQLVTEGKESLKVTTLSLTVLKLNLLRTQF
jgi:hypothetical protein